MFRCRRDAGALNVRSIAPDVRSERSGDALKRHDTAMHRLGLREMDVKSLLVRLDFTKTFPHRHIRWFGVASLWNTVAKQKLFEYRLDANPPRAARTYALLAVAGYEAMVACFDAKYTYWAPRPYHVEPSLALMLPRYNHPSYPSAHACVAGATSEVLSTLFPRYAKVFAQQADDLAASRWHAGIHFPTDSDVGLALGRTVRRFVMERARNLSESN